jgi:hypothetical protein
MTVFGIVAVVYQVRDRIETERAGGSGDIIVRVS